MLKSHLAVAGLLTLGLAVAAAQPPQPRFQPIQPPAGRSADPALNPVPTDSFAFISVKVSKLWDNTATKPLRDWVASQKEGALDAVFGVPFADIDRITFFVPALDHRGPEGVTLVTTRKAYNEARVLKALGVGQAGGG